MVLCVGISKNWVEGTFNGISYRYKKVYYTGEDDKTDGVTAGFVKVKQDVPELKVGCQFEPIYNQYGKLQRIDIYEDR